MKPPVLRFNDMTSSSWMRTTDQETPASLEFLIKAEFGEPVGVRVMDAGVFDRCRLGEVHWRRR